MSRRSGTGGGEWVHPRDANRMDLALEEPWFVLCVAFLPWMNGLQKQSFLKDSIVWTGSTWMRGLTIESS